LFINGKLRALVGALRILLSFSPATLVVQVEQGSNVCVSLWTVTCEMNDLLHRHVLCWFNLTLSGSGLKVVDGS